MRKRDELSKPDSCLNKAREGEMTFILLGRDPAAPEAIRSWVRERIRLRKNSPIDHQIAEALNCAKVMEDERREGATGCVVHPACPECDFILPEIHISEFPLAVKCQKCSWSFWVNDPREGSDSGPNKGEVGKSAVDHLSNELSRVIIRARMEYSLTYAEAVGVLELVKSDLIDEARNLGQA